MTFAVCNTFYFSSVMSNRKRISRTAESSWLDTP